MQAIVRTFLTLLAAFLWVASPSAEASEFTATPTPTLMDRPLLYGDCALTSTGNIPLNDLGRGSYKGFTAGLYPAGSDTPPAAHAAAALAIATDQIKPLDSSGSPDAVNGRIVMISIGMSNTTQEFASKGAQAFKPRADADPAKNPQLVLVDGAQSNMDAPAWIDPNAETWSVVNEQLSAAGVTPAQVQVAWLKEALRNPNYYGEFPAHAQTLQADLEIILRNLKTNFPNIKIVYLSSRTRAYTDIPTDLQPEPFAYETGFAVKWTIEDQINGAGNLNFDPAQGAVLAPITLWGPYIWADGLTARSDGLTWLCSDLESDFTHPSADGGVPKVADQLLAFFKTDPTATPWFLTKTVTGQPPTVTVGASVLSGDAPLNVNFTASASDPDGTIAAYQWTFDDGTFSTVRDPAKTFPAPGDYSVHLTVTDNGGNTVLQSLPIAVALPQDSATPTPTPIPDQTPVAPTNLVATAISSSRIVLSWVDNSKNESGFQIQRSNNGVNFTSIATLGANVTIYTDTERTPATTYYYRVGAFNAIGDSAASNVASATTLPAASPTPILGSTPTPTPMPTSTPRPSPTPALVSISGIVTYCSNPALPPVRNVTMTLTGTSSGSTLSDGFGNYSFSSLPSGGNYTVMPTKIALAPGSGGVNTLDVIATQRHFLNLGTPLTGCRLIAADVNGVGGINTLDVIAMQRFFLGQVTGTANTGKYQFNPVNRTYTGLVTNQTGQNCDAIVFGDLAGSTFVHGPGGLSQTTAGDDMSAGKVPSTVATVSLPNVAVAQFKSNVIAAVKISEIDAKNKLVGFQGDFTFDERVVTFQDPPVSAAGLTAGNWNVSGNVLLGTGPIRTLRISAYSEDFAPLSGSGALFNLNMTRVSKTAQSTPLIWATPPDDFIFIDADLNTQRAGNASPGSVTSSGKQK